MFETGGTEEKGFAGSVEGTEILIGLLLKTTGFFSKEGSILSYLLVTKGARGKSGSSFFWVNCTDLKFEVGS